MRFKSNQIRLLFRENPKLVVLGIVCVFMTSFGLAKSADFINLITSHIQSEGSAELWPLIFLACLTQLLHYVTKYGLAVSCRSLSFKLCKSLRLLLMRHWNTIPFRSYEEKQTGGYLSIAQNDTENASFYVYVLFSRIGMSAFNIAMALPFMIFINAELTVLVMSVSFGFGAVNRHILKKIKQNETLARVSQEGITNTVTSGFDSADSIKVYRAEDYINYIYKKVRFRYSRARMNTEGIDSARNGLYNIVNNATLYGSIIYLTYRTLRGESTLGDTLSFNILLTQALVAIEMIYRWTGSLVRCNASWERLETEMSLTEEKRGGVGGSQYEYSPDLKAFANMPGVRETVCVESFAIKNFSFSYTGGAPVFENLSMHFEKGKIYHIVGESGSGKTTLIKCLLGLYQADGGFTLNGKDTGGADISSYMVYVPSEHFLFNGSLYENLSLGDTGITQEKCLELADLLGVGCWIRSLPDGLAYEVSTGGENFSGGQKQMICVLRALTRLGLSILVLDEPFSALDAEWEKNLRDALLRIKNDYIVLITSHRHHSVDFCDEVISIS